MDFSFEAIVDSANDVILVTEARPLDGGAPPIVYVNRAFSEVTGYAPEEAVGRSARLLHGPETSEDSRERIDRAMLDGRTVRTEIVHYTRDGRRYVADLHLLPLYGTAGHITHWVSISRDLTEQKAHERLLLEMATTDSLTGLANRRQFLYRTREELARARRYRVPLSVLMFDLDHFKRINDTHGHAGGDLVLRQVAAICRQSLRECDILARIGGEEFAAALPETPGEGARVAAERLRAALQATPVAVGEHAVRVTASFGVTAFDPADTDPLALLSRADTALYQAKREGRNRVAG